KTIAVSPEQIQAGLKEVRWPGRLQLLERPGGTKVLLDGAHNIAGATALRETIEQDFAGANKTLILGILEDKDWRRVCQILSPVASEIRTVRVPSRRTANPDELTEACRAANPWANVSACQSLNEALRAAASSHFIIITGSLYLIGEALELLGEIPHANSERELNEWGNVEASKGLNC
ncbi:MAG: glutamate ligase domain-containing protein, partial [Limisphaerales bacterium]